MHLCLRGHDLAHCRGYLAAPLRTAAALRDNVVVPGANRGERLAELGPEIDAVDVVSTAEAAAGGPPGDGIIANVRLSIRDAVDRAGDVDEHGCCLPLRIGGASRAAPLVRPQLGVHPIIEFDLVVTGCGRFVGM